MRLREIREILKQALPALNAIKLEGLGLPNGQPGSRVQNWREALEAARTLSVVRALKPEVAAVLNLEWSQLAGDPAVVPATVSSPISSAISHLQASAAILERLLDSLVPLQTSATVSVKLPEVQDLQELETLVSDVDAALARPANVLFGSCVRFSNVDHGSTWIELAIELAKSPAAAATAGAVVVAATRKNILGFLGGLVEIYGKLVRMRLRNRMVEAHLESLGMSTAAKEAETKHEAEENRVSTEEVERLIQLYGADSEHRADAVPVALHATKIGAQLLQRGGEVHARLEGSKSTPGARVDGWPEPEEIKAFVANPIAQLTTGSEPKPAQRTHLAKKDE